MLPAHQAVPAAIPNSTRFAAPSEPLARQRRLSVHIHVARRVRAFLQERGFVAVPAPPPTDAIGSGVTADSGFELDNFGATAFARQSGRLLLEELIAGGCERVYGEGQSLRKNPRLDGCHRNELRLVEVEARGLELDDLIALQEALIKDVASGLDADLLGGPNVTRLDRMIRSDAVRLTYREALAVLGVRGRSLAFGEALDRDAEAALVRYAGNLPVHVTHFPASLKPFDLARDDGDAETAVCVGTILPCSGETFEGGVRESSAELLASRLREDRMYRGLMQRACDLARERAAGGGATDAASGDAEALGARYQRTIETAFARYLGRFAGGEVRRAGFGLEIARLLQYFMGVDSVKQAVVFPLDRTSLGSGG